MQPCYRYAAFQHSGFKNPVKAIVVVVQLLAVKFSDRGHPLGARPQVPTPCGSIAHLLYMVYVTTNLGVKISPISALTAIDFIDEYEVTNTGERGTFSHHTWGAMGGHITNI